jgi:hypothetical protein
MTWRSMGKGRYIFLISVLHWGQRTASWSVHFTPVERIPNNHWLGGFADPMEDLDAVVERENLCPRIEPVFFCRSSGSVVTKLNELQQLIWWEKKSKIKELKKRNKMSKRYITQCYDNNMLLEKTYIFRCKLTCVILNSSLMCHD